LGLWLGDGSSYGTYLYTKDLEIEEFNKNFAKSIGLNHKTYVDPRNGVKTVKVICGKGQENHLRKTMISLGLLKNAKNKTNKKHIPNIYLINSKENRLKLLAGLIDSDGHATNKGTNYTITQTNKKLSYNILELLNDLILKPSDISWSSYLHIIIFKDQRYIILGVFDTLI
jgi:replicative DNA helicase